MEVTPDGQLVFVFGGQTATGWDDSLLMYRTGNDVWEKQETRGRPPKMQMKIFICFGWMKMLIQYFRDR
jgi:hypothetical protein